MPGVRARVALAGNGALAGNLKKKQNVPCWGSCTSFDEVGGRLHAADLDLKWQGLGRSHERVGGIRFALMDGRRMPAAPAETGRDRDEGNHLQPLWMVVLIVDQTRRAEASFVHQFVHA